MLKISTLSSRARYIGVAVGLVGVTLAAALQPILVSAAQVTDRSLTLSSSAPGNVTTGSPGSATNGQKVTYLFKFKPGTSGNIQSWSAMVCQSAFGYLDGSGIQRLLSNPCTGPTGFTAANLTGITPTVTVNNGSASAGWTIGTASANVIRITNASPVAVTAGQEMTVTFTADATHYITNPTTSTYTSGNFENTFFAHMDTYSAADWDVTSINNRVDDGTVASAITTSIGITAKVQETLKFSVGVATTPTGGSVTAPTAACNALDPTNGNGNTLTMGDTNGALSPTTAYDAHSYFRVSTNSAYGTAVQYVGGTLRASATNTITAIGGTAAVSSPGSEQFGLGIDNADTTTNGHSFTQLTASSNYNASNGAINGTPVATFAFVDTEVAGGNQYVPQTIASSSGFIACDTGSVRYAANIDNNTEAGIYRTTINYIAVPRY